MASYLNASVAGLTLSGGVAFDVDRYFTMLGMDPSVAAGDARTGMPPLMDCAQVRHQAERLNNQVIVVAMAPHGDYDSVKNVAAGFVYGGNDQAGNATGSFYFSRRFNASRCETWDQADITAAMRFREGEDTPRGGCFEVVVDGPDGSCTYGVVRRIVPIAAWLEGVIVFNARKAPASASASAAQLQQLQRELQTARHDAAAAAVQRDTALRELATQAAPNVALDEALRRAADLQTALDMSARQRSALERELAAARQQRPDLAAERAAMVTQLDRLRADAEAEIARLRERLERYEASAGGAVGAVVGGAPLVVSQLQATAIAAAAGSAAAAALQQTAVPFDARESSRFVEYGELPARIIWWDPRTWLPLLQYGAANNAPVGRVLMELVKKHTVDAALEATRGRIGDERRAVTALQLESINMQIATIWESLDAINFRPPYDPLLHKLSEAIGKLRVQTSGHSLAAYQSSTAVVDKQDAVGQWIARQPAHTGGASGGARGRGADRGRQGQQQQQRAASANAGTARGGRGGARGGGAGQYTNQNAGRGYGGRGGYQQQQGDQAQQGVYNAAAQGNARRGAFGSQIEEI